MNSADAPNLAGRRLPATNDRANRQHADLLWALREELVRAAGRVLEGRCRAAASFVARAIGLLADLAPVDQPRDEFHGVYDQILGLLARAERHVRRDGAHAAVPPLRQAQSLLFSLGWSWGVHAAGMSPEFTHIWLAGRREPIAC